MVRSQFVVAGDVSSFDAAAFRASLLARFPSAADAAVEASAASVAVDARLVYLDQAAADADLATLSTADASALSADLGVSVESVGVPTLAYEAVAAPPPPASDPVAVLPITLSAMGVVCGCALVAIALRCRALRR